MTGNYGNRRVIHEMLVFKVFVINFIIAVGVTHYKLHKNEENIRAGKT